MKIKHWQGYGTVSAQKIKDPSCTLHIRVTGNHEWGLRRDDEYDLCNWLVKKFDKTVTDTISWCRSHPFIQILEGYTTDSNGLTVDTCDYLFTYKKED